jgi:hypothetical protein
MAECFCGCGAKVKLSRRALNGTGQLVRVQLEGLEQRRPAFEEAGVWEGRLEEYVHEGEAIEQDLQRIVHGGRLRLTYGQREIIEWLNRAKPLFAEEDPSAAVAAAGLAGPDLPAEVLSRRAEIEELREEYEDEAPVCPECGARFTDNAAYLAHVTGEHA